MKRKMAIILSLALAFSMNATALAAPSPSIQKESIQNVVTGTGTAAASQTSGVSGDKAAVLAGTTFTTAGGQVVDPSAVAMVTKTATAAETKAAADSLAAALNSATVQVVNFTGLKALSLTDSRGSLNVVNNVTIALMTAAGEAVQQNGSLSAAFAMSDILGGASLEAGETLQALYQRADGTWVAVPVVISNGTVAVALPAFGEAVTVTFVIAKGAPVSTAAAVTSPRT